MKIIKRSGRQEDVRFDKITARVKRLCYKLSEIIDPIEITQKVVSGLHDGISTKDIDTLAAETAAGMALQHPDYTRLAARIFMSRLHKETDKKFSVVMKKLPLDPGFLKKVKEHASALDAEILHERDFDYDFFGASTLARSYLLKVDGEIVERPQHMLMRTALFISPTVEHAIKTYRTLSEGLYTHATPTLFNAGTVMPQLASCFLLDMQEDSIHGIFDTLKQCGLISKSAGGIGLSVHRIRASGSPIKGTNGTSNGLFPMLRMYDVAARYVDQCIHPVSYTHLTLPTICSV